MSQDGWFMPMTGEVMTDVDSYSVVGDVGDLTLAFMDFGGPWVELSDVTAFWPIEGGSMVLTGAGVALPCSCTPREIVEKMKHVLLQSQGGPQ